jgi:ParB-like chromosome segregation protein Spo0J
MRPDLRVESIPLDRVLTCAANARTHPDEQVAQIAASIAEFGFNVPVQRDKHRRAVSPAVGCRT